MMKEQAGTIKETNTYQKPLKSVEMVEGNRRRRRPLSAFEHIALWASIVRVVIIMSGVITLLIFRTPLNQQIITIGVVSLIIAVILATKMRWALLACVLLAVYLLVITFTQPFVVASLGDPYASAGGFVKFITSVIEQMASILVSGGCIGAAVQNYYQRERWQAPHWLPMALSLVAGIIIGCLYIGFLSQTASLTVTSVNGVQAVHMGDIHFNQPAVTISRGSKLVLINDTPVEHTFFNGSWRNGKSVSVREPGAPVVNNVHLQKSSATIGPFSVEGTYHIFCSDQMGMALVIIVQ